ncbi:DUF998 domain-containing protein [Lichenifustis flavocetrariae]|uniref:DUF998 domain-containing protein n=1 Tax=Lichenifustis flavocetrariae TaxID=2949735 RepID=A0AA41Z0B5_9HYPH|nr:DUF998 domain-containing protein [Lichenifustis flavocetrariae]MCW6508125.1 DUF998 domain-containing protein [Lichenifustis flavocetrariae]
MMAGRRNAAGAIVLVACGQYLVAEGIAAAAWREPPYSYLNNYISDLGVTACGGNGPCSPLHAVMNIGFLLSGVLAIAAALLLAPLWMRPGWGLALAALAALHGIGSIIVGLVHSEPGAAHGTPHLHVLGAYAAILGGNLALIVAGFGLRRDATVCWFRAAGLALGAFGFFSGAGLVFLKGFPAGLLERGAVDTITVWEIVAGTTLVAALLRSSPATPPLTR